MAATSEEQMCLLLSSFDQIYEDFKSGMNEITVFRSKSNVETSRREALETNNKTLKEGKLILISSNSPPLRRSEIEYYAMLAKVGVHHYNGSDLDIIKTIPGDQ